MQGSRRAMARFALPAASPRCCFLPDRLKVIRYCCGASDSPLSDCRIGSRSRFWRLLPAGSSLANATRRSSIVVRAYASTPKTKHGYVCEKCGTVHAKWHGFCNQCRQANSLKEFTHVAGGSGTGGGAAARAVESAGLADKNNRTGLELGKRVNRPYLGAKAELKPQRLSEINASRNHLHWRLPLPGKTGSEFARVLGGGLVPGSVVLVSGDPGVGKSTLLLQIAEVISAGSDEAAPVLYISGEESVEQIGNRAERLKIQSNDIFILAATDLEVILTWIQEIVPRAVVLDSIQTIYLPDASGSSGSISQVRECTSALLRVAKKTNTAIFLIGHVTKSGEIAGPRTMEHMVDVCLHLEGDRLLSQRLLRALKNRFGSTKEVGVFEMVDHGLSAVENPSQLFLSDRSEDDSNASATVGVAMEGSRPLLVEIQALCSPATSLPSKRTFTGIDQSRFNLIVAVLLKQARLRLARQDIFVNVVGGLRLEEPAADIAVAVAIASSYIEKPVPRDTVFVGELGLGGELRMVTQLERRLTEASKLGFKKCVIPKGAKGVLVEGLQTIFCSSLKEVLEKIFNYKTQTTPNRSFAARSAHSDLLSDDDAGCPEVQIGQDEDDSFAQGPVEMSVAQATFSGQYDAAGTLGDACGYANLYDRGYGQDTAAVSSALFNSGLTCGACFAIRCTGEQWCLPGNPSTVVTATTLCLGPWCNSSPLQHFDLSQSAFESIAHSQAKIVPVSYQRVTCLRSEGIHFTITGHSRFNLILVTNVGGAGDVQAVSVNIACAASEWRSLSRSWGQNWHTDLLLDSQPLSIRVTTSDLKSVTSYNVAPSGWKFGQTFAGNQFN